MRRVATHYIWFRQLYGMHYVELDADNRLVGIYPLQQEIAGTEFYDGLLIPVPLSAAQGFEESLLRFYHHGKAWTEQKELFDGLAASVTAHQMQTGCPVVLYLLNHRQLASSEFSTDNSRCNCHIQRL